MVHSNQMPIATNSDKIILNSEKDTKEFAENFLNDCYGMPDMPYWVAIDWEKTWDDGLSWDYTFVNGYVFNNHW